MVDRRLVASRLDAAVSTFALFNFLNLFHVLNVKSFSF